MIDAGGEALVHALVVSNGILWILVVVLAVLVFALTRQIGLLHERIAPVGALAVEQGPKVGEAAPRLEVETLAGARLTLGTKSAARTLLFFLSPSCPVCKTLLPTLARIGREEGADLRIVYASDGEPAEHRAFAREAGLPAERYALSRDLGMRFEVAKLPYAVLVDGDGIVRAKGLVNTREHVESLFEAERLEVGSLQEYARGRAKDEAHERASLEVVDGGASR